MDGDSYEWRVQALARALDEWCETEELLTSTRPASRRWAAVMARRADACRALKAAWEDVQAVRLAQEGTAHA